jgi:hypothetical protein
VEATANMTYDKHMRKRAIHFYLDFIGLPTKAIEVVAVRLLLAPETVRLWIEHYDLTGEVLEPK